MVKATEKKSKRASSFDSSLDKTDDGSTLHDNGIHLLNGEFDYYAADDVITWILESGFKKKKPDHLTLIINSHGGDLPCAFAIIDMMRGSKIPIHTLGIGQISSCGLITFMAGAKGHRILTPSTSILSHQWSGEFSGKAHELISAQRENDLTTSRVMDHYQFYTGLSPGIIREKLLPPHDVFLSAEEALALNICDQVKNLS